MIDEPTAPRDRMLHHTLRRDSNAPGLRSARIDGAVMALLLVAGACSSDSPSVEDSAACASFVEDLADPGSGLSRTYVDGDPLELPTADPAVVGLDPVRLEAAADAMAVSPRAASLLVLRHGNLAFERYFNGFGPADANDVHSLSKSVLSVFTGIAIDDGLLDLDTPVSELLPAELVREHGDITVHDMLTMSGGMEVPSPEIEWEPGQTNTPVLEQVFAWPRVAEPGTELAYSTGLSMVLAAVVAEAAGMPLCNYAAHELFGRLGIDVEYWNRAVGGYFAGGDSLFMTPRDIARFGQLVIDDGVFDGEQIVPAAWLTDSMAPRWDVGCVARPWLHQTYGYQWWGVDIGGHKVWLASGAGAQDLAIIDDLDLMVVVTHDTTDRTEGLPVAAIELLDDLLIGAVEGESDPGQSPQCAADALVMARTEADGSDGGGAIDGWTFGAVGPLSPAGDRITFTRSADLYTIATDGTDEVRLTADAHGEFDTMPAWSPDGTAIAFARGPANDSDLAVIAADGTGLDLLASLDGWANAPTWSPDGGRIAFVHDTTDVPGAGHPGELWVIDRDGTGLMLLRVEPTSNPAWSPDGDRIAFDGILGDEHIHVLDLATGAVTDLGEGTLPRWSPDGDRLTFVVLDGEGGSDVFTMAADGTDRVQVTEDPAFDTLPQWSADGAAIWYATRAG